MVYFQYIISAVFLFLFIFITIRYRSRHAVLYAVICLLVSLKSFGYGCSLNADSLEKLAFSLSLEFAGYIFIPAFWIFAALTYGKKDDTSSLCIFIIFFVPVITFFLALTTSYHGLYYSKLNYSTYRGFVISEVTYGPAYYLFIIHACIVAVVSVWLYFKTWKQSRYAFSSAAFYLLIGTLSPIVVYVISLSNLLSTPYDITALGFIGLAAAYYYAFSKFGCPDLINIARSRIFDGIFEGILVIDAKERIIDYNTAAQNTFSWLSPESLGQKLSGFEGGQDMCAQTLDHFYLQLWIEDELRYFSFSTTPVNSSQHLLSKKEGGKTYGKIYVFQDITDQKHTLDELHFMASHDALSGLFNRRKIMEEAEKDFYRFERYGAQLSVMMMDIDHFKHVNDFYGHLAGDIVIQNMSAICKDRLRISDSVGRYGGEEFLFLLSETDLESALIVAESLRSSIENSTVYYEGRVIRITVSIGVASTSGMNQPFNLTKLINMSDRALLQAKNDGRNRIVAG